MKFFNFLISGYPFKNSAYPDDVQGIPVPSHLLYCLYSKPHIQLPINGAPNTTLQVKEILAEEVVMSFPSTSLQDHSRLWRGNTQCAYAHDPYLQLPLVYEHSRNYRFEQLNLDIINKCHPLIHDNATLLPKLYEHLTDLHNENHTYILPCCNSKKFYRN